MSYCCYVSPTLPPPLSLGGQGELGEVPGAMAASPRDPRRHIASLSREDQLRQAADGAGGDGGETGDQRYLRNRLSVHVTGYGVFGRNSME